MNDINKAVAYAMVNIAVELETNINALSQKAGVNGSLFYHIVNGRSTKPAINTIFLFCQAAEMTLEEFFARKEFEKCYFSS